MDIELGYNPTPSKSYFISIKLDDNEWISFDNTTKGFRVIKQVLTNKNFALPKDISGEWNDIVLKDGKFVRRNHCVWYDFDRFDIVNNETWETVWEKPISNEDNNLLLNFSRFVADHLENLSKYKNEMDNFEIVISGMVKKYQ